jgi:hypothetical protein
LYSNATERSPHLEVDPAMGAEMFSQLQHIAQVTSIEKSPLAA